jgi:hypothetical protein
MDNHVYTVQHELLRFIIHMFKIEMQITKWS